jgi:CRISPR-associated protein Cas5d
MTPSAARGVLEAIYWKPEFDYVITGIEVLAPIRWVSIRRNEVTSMVTLDWVRTAMADPAVRFDVESGRDQRNTVFLRDVAYRIRAQVRPRPHAGNPEAAYREQFRRRVDRGACFSQPFLGTRECSATFTKDTGQPPEQVTEDLGMRKASAGKRKASASTGICLVCGQPGPLLGTIPDAVKAGAIPAGTGRVRDAQLVSVNKPAQGRGGKLQLASAPVCDR